MVVPVVVVEYVHSVAFEAGARGLVEEEADGGNTSILSRSLTNLGTKRVRTPRQKWRTRKRQTPSSQS